jgi:hypothetical protein
VGPLWRRLKPDPIRAGQVIRIGLLYKEDMFAECST